MWTYEQSSGKLYDSSGVLRGIGYSGQPPHTNVSADEGLVNLGPIPCGLWIAISVISHDPRLGNFVIVLEPDAETRARVIALGRDPDSFRFHGERLAPPPGYASDGCMVNNIAVRQNFWYSGDHPIQVLQGEINVKSSIGTTQS